MPEVTGFACGEVIKINELTDSRFNAAPNFQKALDGGFRARVFHVIAQGCLEVDANGSQFGLLYL